MKIPKARKLPSGKWFCRVRINDQDIAITRDTEKEAVAEAMAVKAGIKDAAKKPKRKTLTTAIDEYIDARRNIISPSTVRGYKIIQDNRFQSMMKKDIFLVTQEQWQRAVNAEARLVNAKTLTNSWRFIASVIHEATGTAVSIKLPQIVRNERPWLTPDQIPVFVQAVNGTNIEIPALLALSSLRCSELLDLKWENVDLKKNTITISGSAVYDEEGNLVHKKENKNSTSRRTVPIIPPLHAALSAAPHKGEYIVNLTSNWIYKSINKICAENGLPEVGIHGLRHSFASLAFHLNMPEKVAMQIGGWANDATMKRIYTHLSQASVNKHAEAFTAFFSDTPATVQSEDTAGNPHASSADILPQTHDSKPARTRRRTAS